MVCSQDIWSSKECSGNQHQQNMQKKSFDNKSKHHRDSAIRNWLFFFLMDEQFHPIIWFLKRKLHSITVGETGRETTASTANEKRKTSLPLRQYTDIYCSCSRRETFSFQLFVHFYGSWPNPAKNLLVVLMPTIHTIYSKYMLWFNVFWLKLYFPFY